MILVLLVNILILALVIWNALAWPAPAAAGKNVMETCSILIPARNEESNLPHCLDSALRQGKNVIEIIVCNDNSEDATLKTAEDYGKIDSRVRVISAGPLPEGWIGKNFACSLLASEAQGDWIMFLDADTRLSPDTVSSILAEAFERDCTFLSPWPRLILGSKLESALMPMLNFAVFTFFPAPLSLRRNYPSLGLAHGACILIKRAEYEAGGGHKLVFDEIFEDTALARAWRDSDRRGICLDGQNLVRVRMYKSPGEIWRGFEKNFFPAFSKAVNFWLFLGFHGVFFLMPFVILPWLFTGHLHLWPLGASALCILIMRLVQALKFRYPLWSIFAHPLAEVIMIAIGLSSWRHCRTGVGISWKGRTYFRSSRHE
jgi:glycosyltransferase involved in cell wall biosynthesis